MFSHLKIRHYASFSINNPLRSELFNEICVAWGLCRQNAHLQSRDSLCNVTHVYACTCPLVITTVTLLPFLVLVSSQDI